MHLKNIYFVNLWLVFCLLFTTACNDDDNIYFTQDEIIGDINSGKQIALENNTLVVYTNNMATSVNVQGAKGKIHATSSDENIVLVTSSNEGKATVSGRSSEYRQCADHSNGCRRKFSHLYGRSKRRGRVVGKKNLHAPREKTMPDQRGYTFRFGTDRSRSDRKSAGSKMGDKKTFLSLCRELTTHVCI